MPYFMQQTITIHSVDTEIIYCSFKVGIFQAKQNVF